MSDADLAIKAPESDAQEDQQPAPSASAIAEDGRLADTPPASMGEHCTTDRPAPFGQTATGEMTKYDNVDVYVTKPADYPHSPSKLLLLLTGGTGVHSINNQLQADKFAAEGYLVVMPDQFANDPAPTATTANVSGQTSSLLEQIKLGVASVAKSFTIDMWLARHTPEKVLPMLHRVITSVKEEFADAVASGGGIYAVGYCFGARYVLLLGAEIGKDVVAGQRSLDSTAEEGMVTVGPLIKAGAIAHGTQVEPKDLAEVRVPVSIVAVEHDSLFPETVLDAGRQSLKENNVDHEVHIFPGVPHGFAVLGDYDDTNIVAKQQEAFDQMLAWLKAH